MSSNRDKRSKRRSSRLGALPLTSMIDVVFLLLIFFLVTANFAQEEHKLPATLQTEGGGVRSSDLQPQILQIRMQGGEPIFVMGEVAVRDGQSLEAVLGNLPKEPGVAIKSEPDVPISAIAAALQAARNAGFTKRSYVPSDGN
jgi:biopolymer transport protein ExbD